MTIAEQRASVVAEALSWMETPFHHAAALKGVGVDCAQLLIESFAVIGVERPDVGEYATDWFLHEDSDRFLAWVEQYCVPAREPEPGNVALFRYGRGISHGAIVVDAQTVVHSFRGLGVTLGSLAPTHDLFPRLAGFWALRRWTVA